MPKLYEEENKSPNTTTAIDDTADFRVKTNQKKMEGTIVSHTNINWEFITISPNEIIVLPVHLQRQKMTLTTSSGTLIPLLPIQSGDLCHSDDDEDD